MYIFLPKPIPTHKHIASNWITIIDDERIIHGKRYKRIIYIYIYIYLYIFVCCKREGIRMVKPFLILTFRCCLT